MTHVPLTDRSCLRFRPAKWFAVCLCLTAVAGLPASDESAAGFQSRLIELQSQMRDQQSERPTTATMIDRYEQLIASRESAPEMGQAIRDLAELHSLNNDNQARPIGNSLNRSVTLYRQVRQIAPPGSDLWTEASFGLAYQLRRQEDVFVALPEARSILNEIRESSAGTRDVGLRLKEQQVLQATAEKDFDTAEAACRDLLALTHLPTAVASGIENESLLRRCQQIAVSTLLNGVIRSADPERMSLKWFDQFAADFPNHDFVQQRVTIFRAQLPAVAVSSPGRPGRTLLLINVGMACALAGTYGVCTFRGRHRLTTTPEKHATES